MKKLVLSVSMLVALSIAGTESQAQTVKSREDKDAAIGAGAGAVTGAVISHKKGKGAVVGGIVGAGAGYLYGRHKDKKNGIKH